MMTCTQKGGRTAESSSKAKTMISAPITMVSNVRVFTADAHNVYAFRNNHKKNTVVVCAHHDHIGINEYENSRHTGPAEIHNGADDNASGVAAMLEMARTLKGKKYKKNNLI